MKTVFRIFRHLFPLVLIVVIGLALYQYKLVLYGMAQLKGQLHIVWNAKPVEEVLADNEFPDSLKNKLRLIGEIRRFSIDTLGLKDSKNYTTLYDQKGKPVLWVITACEPFAMKAYEWHFPFLGDVSYKGFFVKEKGIPEVEKLKAQGYDTDYHPAGGWSTLGWFKDPILSNMLRRNEGQLAELIIHELTHATLYLPGSVDYNENFATFVGEQGAIKFLQSKFGRASTELNNYTEYQHDEEVFGEYMLQACHSLDSLYRNMNSGLTRFEKSSIKYKHIVTILSGIHQLNLYHPERYAFNTKNGQLPNNAFFMSYSRYRKKQSTFYTSYIQEGADVRKFIESQKKSASN